MMFSEKVRIRSFETGLVFRAGDFLQVLEKGTHRISWLHGKLDILPLDRRSAWFRHKDLGLVVRSGALEGKADFLRLEDNQRALIWCDGIFEGIAGPGLHGLWKEPCETRFEIVDVRDSHFIHPEINSILSPRCENQELEVKVVSEGFAGVLQRPDREPKVLSPGRHTFWRNTEQVTVRHLDMRETVMDVTGQEILTGDKVTVRLNAVVTVQVTDPVLAVTKSGDPVLALHREVQLALRAVVGTRDLDQLLGEKDRVAAELKSMTSKTAEKLGMVVLQVGIRDIILPGEMKDLMNKVIQARKVAEANLVKRREEVAAIRSQANTAKILEGNPTLMRLKELEVLQSIASNGKLEVILGEKGLADRVINLL